MKNRNSLAGMEFSLSLSLSHSSRIIGTLIGGGKGYDKMSSWLIHQA